MKILAIDPGASGGIAWCDDENNVQAIAMPETDGDLVDFLQSLRIGVGIAWVEEVGGFIGRPQPGSAMFKFGFGAGVIRGAFIRNLHASWTSWRQAAPRTRRSAQGG